MLGWRPNPDGSISVWRMTSSTAGTLLGTSAAGVIISNVWHWVDEWDVQHRDRCGHAQGRWRHRDHPQRRQHLRRQAGSTTFDGCVIGARDSSARLDRLHRRHVFPRQPTSASASAGSRIRPNADTATKQWTPSSGVVNYNRVNDDDGQNTATYNQSNTLNQTDLYDCVDLSGIPVNIDYVQITCFAQKSDAGARSIGLIADVSASSCSLPTRLSPLRWSNMPLAWRPSRAAGVGCVVSQRSQDRS
jgi:hypothetical protein